MRIGQLSVQTRVSVQALRYYERRGLIPSPQRRPSGFRVYQDDVPRRVHFIRRAQELGFTLDEVGELLGFWKHPAKSCAAVEARANQTLERIDAKIADLKRMRKGLSHYVTACHRQGAAVECPLLDALGHAAE